MLKWLMMILVFSCAISLCSIQESICRLFPIPGTVYGQEFIVDSREEIISIQKTPAKSVNKVKDVIPIQEYTVVSGDTLGHIAERYGTTWEKLWDINKDRVVDPNLIYIGQKIRLTGKTVPAPPKMTREEKIDKLARFMFKTAGLNFATKAQLESQILTYQNSLYKYGLQYMDNQRNLINMYHTTTRQYEIWLLAEAIIDTVKDDETFYKLVGLVWQESHFVNKMGKSREVSFFQFLPATVKARLELDDIQLVKVLWDLNNDPKIATELAIDMLTELKWNWLLWNGGTEFGYHVNNKIHWFKYEWLKK